MKPTYAELLKHPKWQKRRLEVLESHNFVCDQCESSDKTLNVHHGYYEKGKKPWEYPDDAYHCLCDDCHKSRHDLEKRIRETLGKLQDYDLRKSLAYSLCHDWLDGPEQGLIIDGYEEAEGVGDYWGLTPEEIIGSLDSNYMIFSQTIQELRRKKTGRA